MNILWTVSQYSPCCSIAHYKRNFLDQRKLIYKDGENKWTAKHHAVNRRTSAHSEGIIGIRILLAWAG